VDDRVGGGDGCCRRGGDSGRGGACGGDVGVDLPDAGGVPPVKFSSQATHH
jgi:hypothetical protein